MFLTAKFKKTVCENKCSGLKRPRLKRAGRPASLQHLGLKLDSRTDTGVLKHPGLVPSSSLLRTRAVMKQINKNSSWCGWLVVPSPLAAGRPGAPERLSNTPPCSAASAATSTFASARLSPSRGPSEHAETSAASGPGRGSPTYLRQQTDPEVGRGRKSTRSRGLHLTESALLLQKPAQTSGTTASSRAQPRCDLHSPSEAACNRQFPSPLVARGSRF